MSAAIKPDYESLYIQEKEKYNKLLSKHYELERANIDLARENKILSAQMDIVYVLCGRTAPAR